MGWGLRGRGQALVGPRILRLGEDSSKTSLLHPTGSLSSKKVLLSLRCVCLTRTEFSVWGGAEASVAVRGGLDDASLVTAGRVSRLRVTAVLVVLLATRSARHADLPALVGLGKSGGGGRSLGVSLLGVCPS